MAIQPLQACAWGLLAGVLAACAVAGPNDRGDRQPLPIRHGPVVHACPDTIADDDPPCQPVAAIAMVRPVKDTLASAEPMTCTPASVVRGQRVSCVMRAPGWTVTSWEFVPEPAAAAAGRLPVVRENTSNPEWAGPVAVGGVVTVYVTDGSGHQESFQSSFAVTPRPSPWRSTWGYRRDSTATDAGEPAPPGRDAP
jgi:hypothetical protein